MKLAIVSDLHLGDPNCALLRIDLNDGKKEVIEDKVFSVFCNTIGENNDCLILLGDIMDFAMRDYEAVYRLASYFFTAVKKKKLARRIVYIPGNHDYSIWDIIEYQANIIKRVEADKDARNFRMTVPLLIDERKGDFDNAVDLLDVKKMPGTDSYGGMFLDHLIEGNDPGSIDYIPFIIAFPNIYLVTSDGRLAVMTHGQFLETSGSIASGLYRTAKNFSGTFSMKDYISINFPVSQAGSTGIGQAGPLSDLIREIGDAAKRADYGTIRKYTKRVISALLRDTWLRFVPFSVSFLTALSNLGITAWVKKMRNSNYTEDLEGGKDEGATERFKSYIDSSMDEFRSLGVPGIEKKSPDIFLFGHTHIPVTGYHEYKGIRLLNSGGWLRIINEPAARGSGVVFHYSNEIITSTVIDLRPSADNDDA